VPLPPDDWPQLYAAAFSTQAGEKVLQHLRQVTIERMTPPAIGEGELRELEGRRNLIRFIEQQVKTGRNPPKPEE
jgi:hypothetical protein